MGQTFHQWEVGTSGKVFSSTPGQTALRNTHPYVHSKYGPAKSSNQFNLVPIGGSLGNTFPPSPFPTSRFPGIALPNKLVSHKHLLQALLSREVRETLRHSTNQILMFNKRTPLNYVLLVSFPF